MITSYKIVRLSSTVYFITDGENIIYECSSFTEAQDYLFTLQAQALMGEEIVYGRQ